MGLEDVIHKLAQEGGRVRLVATVIQTVVTMKPLPPCELTKIIKHMAQTYVIKVAGTSMNVNEVLQVEAKCRVYQGAGACAVVEVQEGQKSLFFVQTCDKECEEKCFENKVKKEFLKLPNSPQVEWVRPMTRQLQRLLGLGDVTTTREDVVCAAEAGDVEELKIIMPQAERQIDQGLLKLLPAIWDTFSEDIVRAAARDSEGTPALQDAQQARECNHDFFGFRHVLGPCKRGSHHYPPYTQCLKCQIIWCTLCARTAEEQQAEREEVQDALEGQPRAFQMNCSWQQHPTRPLPFYVIDEQKVSATDKVAWIRRELGDDAELDDFAIKFLELFDNKINGAKSQKSTCLELFCKYTPAGSARVWTAVNEDKPNEKDIPPEDLERFLRVWDERSGRAKTKCCHECSKKHKLQGNYCSVICRDAGLTFSCRRCDTILDSGIPRGPGCDLCKKGPPTPGSCAALEFSWKLWMTNSRKDPAHEPAWKKRRLS